MGENNEKITMFWAILILAVIDIALNLLDYIPVIGPLTETGTEIIIEIVSGLLLAYITFKKGG
jgi:hypothetical protein